MMPDQQPSMCWSPYLEFHHSSDPFLYTLFATDLTQQVDQKDLEHLQHIVHKTY